MSGFEGLDRACPVCEREFGDHTMREYAACFGAPTTDLPYEDLPPHSAAAAAGDARQIFGFDSDVVIADNVVARALVLDGYLRVKLPAVLCEFAIGVSGSPPVPVAKIAFIGSVQTVQGFGRLIADTADGAIRAAGGGS